MSTYTATARMSTKAPLDSALLPSATAPSVTKEIVNVATKTPTVSMMFPYSSRSQIRTLVFRNTTEKTFFVKLITSNQKLLQMQKTALLCDAYSSDSVKVLLNAELIDSSKALELKEYIYVYCIGVLNRTLNEVRFWLKNDVQAESELAYKLAIVRSKEFAALEMVVDLPGFASPLKAIVHPSYTVDDSDCITAHNVDSDTDTVVPLSDDELLAVLPPDSMIATATDGRKCWLYRAFEQIFPNSGGKDSGSEMPCGGS